MGSPHVSLRAHDTRPRVHCMTGQPHISGKDRAVPAPPMRNRGASRGIKPRTRTQLDLHSHSLTRYSLTVRACAHVLCHSAVPLQPTILAQAASTPLLAAPTPSSTSPLGSARLGAGSAKLMPKVFLRPLTMLDHVVYTSTTEEVCRNGMAHPLHRTSKHYSSSVLVIKPGNAPHGNHRFIPGHERLVNLVVFTRQDLCVRLLEATTLKLQRLHDALMTGESSAAISTGRLEVCAIAQLSVGHTQKCRSWGC
ncbi:hypothetical protein BC628DRAFT_534498 [Trametes gibbosa]|nr:hypothetical protein BC628DRAFT_534498 [Trametes gibbosa]